MYKIKTWSKIKKHKGDRFLPSSYKQEIYLNITSSIQKDLNVEEYIREFKQLQMRVGLNGDNELIIARFIKGLYLSIANNVELQPYSSLGDVPPSHQH